MDEENTPARRGRPRGTGIDDSPTLAAVADVLLASPGMRPTTAMKRAVRGVKATQLRRLQDKWRTHGTPLMAEAGERARQRKDTAAKAAAARAATPRHDPSAAWRAALGIVDHEAIKAALGQVDLPAMKAVLDMAESPVMKAMRDMAESPAMKQMREIVDPPLMRHLRELENSPITKLARDMERLNRLFAPLGQHRG